MRSRIILGWVAALILAAMLLPSCSKIAGERMYRNGIVVCSDPIAAEIGLTVLKDGGNAIDGACAAALAMAVTLPRAGNIGGGGFATIYLADSQKVFFLDFRETAPKKTRSEMFLNSEGQVDRDKATIGPLSAGVPGTVAGLYELQSRFGGASWSEMVKPARFLADTGFAVYDYLARSLGEYREDLSRFPSTRAVYFPDGQPLAAGDQLVQKDLAETLGLIEANGRDGFYSGGVAEKIEAFCAANGGFITREDLAEYQALWCDPVRISFRDLTVYAPGLPSSGGIVMGQMLSMLDTFELEKYTSQSPEFIHLFTETARRAYADREQYLGDPGFTHDFTKELLDKNYLATRLQSLDVTKATPSANILPGVPKRTESDQTTHLVVVDATGNIVSLTYTMNLPYGSKAIVNDCGFLLNNEMDDFAILPGQANAFGLIGGEANRIEPGKRMLSSMTPTIILKKGKPYLALGARGGSKIISSVTQTILNYRVFGMTVGAAVAAPRIHHQWQPDVLYVEQGGLDVPIIQKLISMGHTIQEREPFCTVNAVSFSDDGHFVTGAGDPRQEGATVAGY